MPDAPQGPSLRLALDALPRYRAGRPAAPGSAALTPYKLASNESPFAPLPGVLAAAQDALADMERYPDFASTRLIAALSSSTGQPADRLSVGTGSVALLQHLVQIVCDDGDEVVYAWRSFEAYPIVTRISGAVPVEVPLTSDHRHDIEAMIAAVGPRTKAMFVCSPNNPTGTMVSADELSHLLAAVPPRVLVVLDEAYIDFVDREQRPDVVALLASHPNLAVLRTFSKAHGLAALRVGYAIASVAVTDALRAVALPFGVSAPAQAAAEASLSVPARGDLALRVAAIVAERQRMVEALDAIEAPMAPTQGNFLWLPVGDSASVLGDAFTAQALSVRVFPGEGVRLTIGPTEANDRALGVITEFHRR